MIKKKIIIYELLAIFIYINYFFNFQNGVGENKINNSFKKFDYINQKFAIIERECINCGLFSFFIVCLGCIHKYLIEGYIPIIDMTTLPNVINGFNNSKTNNWESLFEQPFNFTLENVLKYGKNIRHIQTSDCHPRISPYKPLNEVSLNFWHHFAIKYSPIKNELIELSNKIMFKLFKDSKNILGVLARGTDFVSMKLKDHPIPPNITDVIKDVKEMDNKYNYDYIFFTTEDEIIREQFSRYFQNKLKQVKPNIKINYDYSKKNFLGYNKNINGNIEFNKIYLLNIIILSKCLDLIAAKSNGSVGVLILTNGFRYVKIYNLGLY